MTLINVLHKLSEQQSLELNEEFNDLKPRIMEIYEDVERLCSEYSFEYTDLKLHEISLHRVESESEVDDFGFFCERKYEEFEAYLEEYDLKIDRLGRTSSFELVGTDCKYDSLYDERVRGTKEQTSQLIEEIFEYKLGSWEDHSTSIIEWFVRGDLTTVEDIILNTNVLESRCYGNYEVEGFDQLLFDWGEFMEDFITDIEGFEETWAEVVSDIEVIDNAYKYIDEFKEKQLEIYDDFNEGVEG